MNRFTSLVSLLDKDFQSIISITFSNAQPHQEKTLWNNEVLDGCSKNPLALKTKECVSNSFDHVRLVTQILTHRYLGGVSS